MVKIIIIIAIILKIIHHHHHHRDIIIRMMTIPTTRTIDNGHRKRMSIIMIIIKVGEDDVPMIPLRKMMRTVDCGVIMEKVVDDAACHLLVRVAAASQGRGEEEEVPAAAVAAAPTPIQPILRVVVVGVVVVAQMTQDTPVDADVLPVAAPPVIHHDVAVAVDRDTHLATPGFFFFFNHKSMVAGLELATVVLLQKQDGRLWKNSTLTIVYTFRLVFLGGTVFLDRLERFCFLKLGSLFYYSVVGMVFADPTFTWRFCLTLRDGERLMLPICEGRQFCQRNNCFQ